MIPRETLFDPTPATPPTATLPAQTFLPDPEDDALAHVSRRQDGWSAANQRRFLEAIAEGHGVEAACRCVGLSTASAYAFRRTARGAAFALGWRAASLVAREAIAETLLVRALEGQVDTYVRADGSTLTRHRHDNRLAMSLLARLDRQVEAAPDADVKAARLVAQEFDAYLDLVTRDEGPARAGLFLARRVGGLLGGQLLDGDPDDHAAAIADLAPIYALAAADRLSRTGHASAGEVPVADLDPHARAGWTAEQWQRAEAAGLLRLAAPGHEGGSVDAPQNTPTPQLPQHPPDDGGLDDDFLVWWDEDRARWYTCFPPPDDFDGEEEGTPDDKDYARTLTPAEAAAMGRGPEHHDPATVAALARSRTHYFARIAEQRRVPQLPPLLARLLATREGGGGETPPPSTPTHAPPDLARSSSDPAADLTFSSHVQTDAPPGSPGNGRARRPPPPPRAPPNQASQLKARANGARKARHG